MTTDCQNCDLVRENEELGELIKRQQRVIDTTRTYVLSIYSQAAQALSKHQPRGTWAFWKGSGEVARKVYNLLSGD